MARRDDVKTRCQGSVHDDFGVGFHQCLSRASVERDGKWWCAIHDPEAEQRRRQKQRDKYDAKRRESEAIQRQAKDLCRRLGVTGGAHYDAVFAKGYTRAIVIGFEDAHRLAEALAQRPTLPTKRAP